MRDGPLETPAHGRPTPLVAGRCAKQTSRDQEGRRHLDMLLFREVVASTGSVRKLVPEEECEEHDLKRRTVAPGGVENAR